MKDKSCLLLVIDAQPGMVEHVGLKPLDKIVDEIQAAVREQNPVVFLELTDFAPTLSGLLNSAKGTWHRQIQRETSDGSEALLTLWLAEQLPLQFIRVCGFFAHACVYQTVLGLSTKLQTIEPEIVVVQSACDQFIGSDWVRFESLPGVRLEHS